MKVQIHTDGNIKGQEKMIDRVKDVVESALSKIRDHITRVEVHLSHENSDKSGQDDKRCMMAARLRGRRPVAVTHQAATLDQAIDGAADKLNSVIESTLGRLRAQIRRRTDPPLAESILQEK